MLAKLINQLAQFLQAHLLSRDLRGPLISRRRQRALRAVHRTPFSAVAYPF